jgi:hypothetical protein
VIRVRQDKEAFVAAFEYAAKFVCGKPGADELAPGVYFTAISVHNPTDHGVKLRKKIAIAGRREESGPLSEFFDARLGPDQALEIDCPDIRERARVSDDFLKGFVVLESDVELDVIAVYTAAGGDGQLEAIDVKCVPPRRAEAGLPDLIPVPDPDTEFCKRDEPGNLIVTVRNQGSADAGAPTTTVHFLPVARSRSRRRRCPRARLSTLLSRCRPCASIRTATSGSSWTPRVRSPSPMKLTTSRAALAEG